MTILCEPSMMDSTLPSIMVATAFTAIIDSIYSMDSLAFALCFFVATNFTNSAITKISYSTTIREWNYQRSIMMEHTAKIILDYLLTLNLGEDLNPLVNKI